MHEVAVLGMGAWSPDFADGRELLAIAQNPARSGQPINEKRVLSPAMLPPRERRRAPQTVKMALEVMGQAIAHSGIASEGITVVTASSMGDMEITDYMCRTVGQNPRLISPTSFHNSVHNSAVGYWSISQSSHAACSAVAAGEFTGTAGLLEAVVLCVDTQSPVLLAILEGLAPASLMALCTSPRPLALALLLTPSGVAGNQDYMGRLRITVAEQKAKWPALPAGLGAAYGHNPAGRMLPLFLELAKGTDAEAAGPALGRANPSVPWKTPMQLPLTQQSGLKVELQSRTNVS